MAGRDWDASGEAAEALRTVLEDYGVACLSNAQQMASVLRDLLPNRPREASVLVAAVEADVAAVLRDRVQVGVSPTAAAQQAVAVLEDRTGLAPAACQWAVAAFAGALGYPVDAADLSAETSSAAPAPPAGLVPPQPTGTRADVPPAAAPVAGPVVGAPPAVGGAPLGGAAGIAAPAGPPHLQGVAPDAYLVRPGTPAAAPAQASDPPYLQDPPGMQAMAPDAYLVRPPAQGAGGQPADAAATPAPPPTAAAAQPGAASAGTAPQATAPGVAWPGATDPGSAQAPGGAGYQPTAAAQAYPQAPGPPGSPAAAQPSLYPAAYVPPRDDADLEVRRKFFVAARFAFAAAVLIAAYNFVAPYALGVPFAVAFSILGLSLAGSAIYASRRASAVFGGGAVLGASVATVAFIGNVESVFWTGYLHSPGRQEESALVLLGALVLAVVAAIYAARGLELGPRKPTGLASVLAAGAALFALANIPTQASNDYSGNWAPVVHIFAHGESGKEAFASVAYLVLITLPLAFAALRVLSAAGRAGIWAGWIAAAIAWPIWTALAIAAAPSSYGLTGSGTPVRAETGLYLSLTCWALLLVLGAVGLLRKEQSQPPTVQPPAGV